MVYSKFARRDQPKTIARIGDESKMLISFKLPTIPKWQGQIHSSPSAIASSTVVRFSSFPLSCSARATGPFFQIRWWQSQLPTHLEIHLMALILKLCGQSSFVGTLGYYDLSSATMSSTYATMLSQADDLEISHNSSISSYNVPRGRILSAETLRRSDIILPFASRACDA